MIVNDSINVSNIVGAFDYSIICYLVNQSSNIYI